MKDKNLRYWKERGGQIEWRLESARVAVADMERDLKECDQMIKALTEKAQSRKSQEGGK